MVCVPCFIIPVLLFLWHKFIQPYVLRFWNPWAVKDADGNVKTDFPFSCEGGVCSFGKKQVKNKTEITEPEPTEENILQHRHDNRIKSD
ncbi:UPF0729 protein AAEL015238 [Papilio machaon]|uniref:UPF0729 protein AAEL015238 n=1 Tax=Papilio machaon TaxID=76193 RepID=A0A194RFW7_PAPMA|nr:UPF0729 protein AAEL015238 [Papilio machaon]